MKNTIKIRFKCRECETEWFHKTERINMVIESPGKEEALEIREMLSRRLIDRVLCNACGSDDVKRS